MEVFIELIIFLECVLVKDSSNYPLTQEISLAGATRRRAELLHPVTVAGMVAEADTRIESAYPHVSVVASIGCTEAARLGAGVHHEVAPDSAGAEASSGPSAAVAAEPIATRGSC